MRKCKKFKFYFQYDAMDCGAACLAMISHYYGRNLTRDKIAELCEITRNGVSMWALKTAAQSLGLQAYGRKLTIRELTEIQPLPCILHWNKNHFVILRRITRKLTNKSEYVFHIADPVYGNVKLSTKEFADSWVDKNSGEGNRGLLMFFEIAPDYSQQNESNNIPPNKGLKMLLSYFIKYRGSFIQISIGLLFGMLLQIIFPFLTQAIVDIGIGSRNLSFIYIVLSAQAMLIISRTLVGFIRSWLLLHMSVRINLSLISGFISKLMKLPMSFFESKKTGDILQRIADHEKIENFITSKSLETIFSIFSLISFSVVLLYYNLIIFLVFVGGSLLYALWVAMFHKKRELLNYKFFSKRAQSQSNTYQLITGMQEIKLQGCSHHKQAQWEEVQIDLLELNTQSLKLNQYYEVGNLLLNEGKNMVITIIAATAVISGDITLGMMLAIQYIIGQLAVPIEQTVQFILSLQDVGISVSRINEIYNKKDETDESQLILEDVLQGDIIINNISFRYDTTNRTNVLDNLSCRFERGKVTAIVGCSGSGKTTLIKLLLRYFKPTEGEIKVGNYNLSNLNVDWWRKQCGVVMQNGYIFSDTIARNIATSSKDIDVTMLDYAAKVANIYDTIMSLPLKYQTIIGDEGQGLSQGQRQRLLIARAVYKNPPFIFFDEATNSLDANNEKAIVENLNSYYYGKTVIVVAHRLSTVQNADHIIVMDKGRIVESGTHMELINNKAYYYELVRNQLSLGE